MYIPHTRGPKTVVDFGDKDRYRAGYIMRGVDRQVSAPWSGDCLGAYVSVDVYFDIDYAVASVLRVALVYDLSHAIQEDITWNLE